MVWTGTAQKEQATLWQALTGDVMKPTLFSKETRTTPSSAQLIMLNAPKERHMQTLMISSAATSAQEHIQAEDQ